MELCSLHPFDELAVRDFVARIAGDPPASLGPLLDGAIAFDRLRNGDRRGAYELTYALGRHLAGMHPSFAHQGISLSTWEARIDRGAGMLIRPPARLLIDSGMDPAIARSLPIRLDLSRGMMGGAYVPARLVADFERLLEARLERSVRRLIEAEFDGVAVFGLMVEMAAYARRNGLAIFEALDVVAIDATVPGVPNGSVILADKRRLDKSLRHRLEEAAKPPKKPGLFARLAGRGRPTGSERNL